MAKLTPASIARMNSDEITEVYDHMKKAKRTPATWPPRRPRGEKPTTTIRFLRRQMVTLEHTIAALRMACDDKDKVIAGFDVQMGEQEDQIKSLQVRNSCQAGELGLARKTAIQSAERLAYLEGYFYAKEKEAAPDRGVQAARASVSSYTPQTYAGSGSRDSEGVQVRRQDAAQERAFQSAGGFGAAPGDQIRRAYRDDPQYPEKSPVEHVEINEPKIRHEWTLRRGDGGWMVA